MQFQQKARCEKLIVHITIFHVQNLNKYTICERLRPFAGKLSKKKASVQLKAYFNIYTTWKTTRKIFTQITRFVTSISETFSESGVGSAASHNLYRITIISKKFTFIQLFVDNRLVMNLGCNNTERAYRKGFLFVLSVCLGQISSFFLHFFFLKQFFFCVMFVHIWYTYKTKTIAIP